MKYLLWWAFLMPALLVAQPPADSLAITPADRLFNQGLAHYRTKDWPAAQRWFYETTQHPSASLEVRGRAYYGLGKIHDIQGSYEKSISPYATAITLFRQSTKPSLQHRAALTEKFLAQTYMRQGDFERAIFLLHSAISTYQIYKGNADRHAYAYLELAKCHGFLGQGTQAVEYVKKAERIPGISEKAHIFLVIYQGDLLHDNEGAFQLYQQALAYFEKQSPGIELAGILSNLAGLSLELDDSESGQQRSNAYLQRAFQLVPQVYETPFRREVANLYLTKGQLLQAQGKYQLALPSYHQVLYHLFPEVVDTADLYQLLPDSLYRAENHILRSLRGKAECFHAMGNSLAALDHYRAMVLAEERLAAANAYESSQYSLLEDQRPSLGAALDLATQAGVPSELSYFFFEKSKSQVLNAGVRQAQLEQELLPQELNKEKQTIEMRLAEAEQKLGTEKGNDPYWQNQRDSLRFLRATVLDSIRKYQQKSGELSMTLPFVSLADIQTRLTPDQLMIQYVWEGGLYALAISDTHVQAYRLPAIEEEMALLPQLLHSSPAQETAESIQRYGTSAHSLYQKLLAPILADFPAAKRLRIIPDGALHQLPFEALLTSLPSWDDWPTELAFEQFWKGSLRIPEWGAAYLLLEQEVQYSFSASLWHATKSQTRKPGMGFLGYAPQYSEQDSFRGSRLIPLPSALPHSERIAALFGRKGQVISTAGSKHFLQHAPQAQYLHLAMHSFVDHDFPQRSTLAFGREQGQHSGQIIAAHLYALPLLSARLVSLLACKSGDGKQIEGEGVLSLGRAFRMAGTQAVLMSLWDADARLGGKVLETTYEQLRAGKNASASLSAAKIAYLDQATTFEAHPSHWANYVLFGEDHPQPEPSNSWWIGLLLGGGMLLGWGAWRKWRTSG